MESRLRKPKKYFELIYFAVKVLWGKWLYHLFAACCWNVDLLSITNTKIAQFWASIAWGNLFFFTVQQCYEFAQLCTFIWNSFLCNYLWTSITQECRWVLHGLLSGKSPDLLEDWATKLGPSDKICSTALHPFLYHVCVMDSWASILPLRIFLLNQELSSSKSDLSPLSPCMYHSQDCQYS